MNKLKKSYGFFGILSLKKLGSSSLVEVIVAMIISSVVFMLAFSIILNILSSSKLIKNGYYLLIANSLIDKIKEENVIVEEELMMNYDDYIVITNIKKYENRNDLVKIKISIADKNGTIKANKTILKKK